MPLRMLRERRDAEGGLASAVTADQRSAESRLVALSATLLTCLAENSGWIGYSRLGANAGITAP
jgi:hypothetical protein